MKTLDLGGNAVIGYTQCFDLEGESGIVARGIGTAVTLVKLYDSHQQVDERIAEEYVLHFYSVYTKISIDYKLSYIYYLCKFFLDLFQN